MPENKQNEKEKNGIQKGAELLGKGAGAAKNLKLKAMVVVAAIKIFLIIVAIAVITSFISSALNAIHDFVTGIFGQKAGIIVDSNGTKISSGGIFFDKKEILETIEEALADQGVSKSSLELGNDEKKADKYLIKFMEASIATEMPFIPNKDLISMGTQGIVRINRQYVDGTVKLLDFMEYDRFKEKVESGNKEATRVFSIDESGNLCIAKYYSVEVNGTQTEYTLTEEKIAYRNYISQYTMPIEFLIANLMVSQSANYVAALADLVKKNSSINFAIFDAEDEVTEVYTENKTIFNRTYREPEYLPDGTYLEGGYEVTTTTSTQKTTTITKTNSITAGVTNANTWSIKQTNEYTKKEQPSEPSHQEENGPTETPGEGEGSWVIENRQITDTSSINRDWEKVGEGTKEINKELFCGLWKNSTGIYRNGALFDPDGKIVGYEKPLSTKEKNAKQILLATEKKLKEKQDSIAEEDQQKLNDIVNELETYLNDIEIEKRNKMLKKLTKKLKKEYFNVFGEWWWLHGVEKDFEEVFMEEEDKEEDENEEEISENEILEYPILNIQSADEWLYDLLEKNEKTQMQAEIMRFMFHYYKYQEELDIDLSIFDTSNYEEISYNGASYESLNLTTEDIVILNKITSAERGGGTQRQQEYVVSVILNRVLASGWPNTVEGVVFQKNQFQPTRNGAYEKARPTATTKAAVQSVIKNGDTTGGAVYFMTPASVPGQQSWLKNCMYLFNDGDGSPNGSHDFFTKKSVLRELSKYQVGIPSGGSSSEKLAALFPDGIPNTEAQMQKYIATVKININNKSGKKVSTNLRVHKALASDVVAIFDEIQESGYRAYSVGAYTWRAMAASSSRSHHSYGVAIDINPNENYMIKNGSIVAGSFWKPGENQYSITPNGPVVQAFTKRGWTWGGTWKSSKDYMHFSYTGN